jgi:hypothetical protein
MAPKNEEEHDKKINTVLPEFGTVAFFIQEKTSEVFDFAREILKKKNTTIKAI